MIMSIIRFPLIKFIALISLYIGLQSVALAAGITITSTSRTEVHTSKAYDVNVHISVNSASDEVLSIKLYRNQVLIKELTNFDIDLTQKEQYLSPGEYNYYAVAKIRLNTGTNPQQTVTSQTIKVKVIDGTVIIGNIDPGTANGAVITGWACSTGLDQSIDVHLYAGGPAGVGVGVGSYHANKASESGISAVCGASGVNYRFEIPITQEMKRNHEGKKIYIHGISPVGRENYLLDQSGAYKFPENPRVLGRIDAVSDSKITGWACATTINESIEVHLYARDDDGTLYGISPHVANLQSEQAIT